jgi:small-conductance mechanosensitive channel
MDLQALLNPSTAKTAVASIQQIESALRDVTLDIENNEAVRSEILLENDDSKAAQFDSQLADKRRQVARLRSALTVVRERHDALVDADRKAAARKVIQAAERAAERADKILSEYEAAARKIADLIDELNQCYAEMDRGHEAAANAGLTCSAEKPHLKHCWFREGRAARYEEQRQIPHTVNVDGSQTIRPEYVQVMVEPAVPASQNRAPDLVESKDIRLVSPYNKNVMIYPR